MCRRRGLHSSQWPTEVRVTQLGHGGRAQTRPLCLPVSLLSPRSWKLAQIGSAEGMVLFCFCLFRCWLHLRLLSVRIFKLHILTDLCAFLYMYCTSIKRPLKKAKFLQVSWRWSFSFVIPKMKATSKGWRSKKREAWVTRAPCSLESYLQPFM